VDTIRLDFKDPTWSNVEVAIWNMIESHIGAVAANIPLMGPLISLLGKQLHRLAKVPSSKHGTSDKQGPSKHALGSHHAVGHGFRRIGDDGSGNRMLVGVASPEIGKGASESDEEMYKMDQLGKHGISVKTELEQDYGGRMTPRASVF